MGSNVGWGVSKVGASVGSSLSNSMGSSVGIRVGKIVLMMRVVTIPSFQGKLKVSQFSTAK